MARNAEASRAEIYRAATAEFARYGIAGARMDRIAQTAGFNKNLIYLYFGNKEQLLEAVMAGYSEQLHEAAPLNAGDLAGYATALFDFMLAHPDLVRLSTWSALEGRQLSTRAKGLYEAKLAKIIVGQARGQIRRELAPSAVLSLVNAIATAWTVGTFGVGVSEVSPIDPADQRAAIAAGVRNLLMTETGGKNA